MAELNKRKISITIDESTVSRIKILAEKNKRSFSNYINLVLDEHIEKVDKETKND